MDVSTLFGLIWMSLLYLTNPLILLNNMDVSTLFNFTLFNKCLIWMSLFNKSYLTNPLILLNMDVSIFNKSINFA